MKNSVLTQAELPGLRHVKSGKVRDIFDLGKELLIVATDRLSAFDVVLPNGIPMKGKVLTGLSSFWFAHLGRVVGNHLITDKIGDMPSEVKKYAEALAGRSMIVKKAKPFSVECVVRGYLAGSGLKDYQKTGLVCGIRLPDGLKESDRLPAPIFTPTTKAEEGHDLAITFDHMVKIVGKSNAEFLSKKSVEIYESATAYALSKGIILCDTKFEFGETPDGIILIDEALTPDSSRFWPADGYRPGMSQPSFDKQFVRDYLESIKWNKQPPAPSLPDEIVRKTTQRYVEAYERITGKRLE